MDMDNSVAIAGGVGRRVERGEGGYRGINGDRRRLDFGGVNIQYRV